MNTSSSAPETPLTAKLPSADKKMFPFAVTSNASMSSSLVSPNPTSDPSKYRDHVPAVVLPKEVEVNAITSSSLPPVSPEMDGSPEVDSSNRPSESKVNESMLSVETSKPTSLPSK